VSIEDQATDPFSKPQDIIITTPTPCQLCSSGWIWTRRLSCSLQCLQLTLQAVTAMNGFILESGRCV